MAEIDQPLFLNDVISTSSSGVSIETEPLLLAGQVSQPPAWEGAPPLLVDPQRWGVSVSRSGEISVSVVIELQLAPDLEPPALTPGAAAVLLRILRKAHEREVATDRGRTLTDDQAVA
jgi:hypothetical protein